ncbi:MAG: hypothetical protein JWR73_2959 [Tardiphaga sp.]|nr:hypothetical protein [Tardiphaga sp.]
MSMCNLYSLTRPQASLRQLFKVEDDLTGNLPPLPGIYPDAMAPVIHLHGGRTAMGMMRWGFPPPPTAAARPVTNIRNAGSPFWRPWFTPENRCLVPATSFCEWTDKAPKVAHWFALNDERPVFAFAGIWRPWTGVRGTKANPVVGEHHLFAFLTTSANAIVGPVHAKAMPVILREDEWTTWLTAPTPHALRLQTPLPDSELTIVATGVKEDPGVDAVQHTH